MTNHEEALDGRRDHPPLSWLRRLYHWVIGFAEKPSGSWALFWISLAESSFFPIPPDVLLIPLCIGSPRRSLWFAAICTAGSVVGAAVGYLIGAQFFELMGRPILDFYGAQDRYAQVQSLYQEYDAIAVGIAGLTPIPFKVFTIAAGVFEINLLTFILASAVSRGLRFFGLATLIYFLGASIQAFIEKYFNWLTILFVVLLLGGFWVLKYAI